MDVKITIIQIATCILAEFRHFVLSFSGMHCAITGVVIPTACLIVSNWSVLWNVNNGAKGIKYEKNRNKYVKQYLNKVYFKKFHSSKTMQNTLLKGRLLLKARWWRYDFDKKNILCFIEKSTENESALGCPILFFAKAPGAQDTHKTLSRKSVLGAQGGGIVRPTHQHKSAQDHPQKCPKIKISAEHYAQDAHNIRTTLRTRRLRLANILESTQDVHTRPSAQDFAQDRAHETIKGVKGSFLR